MESKLYISELLEQHDCVIIPGLGGFIGSYHPAGINPVYHIFQPPYKKLLFNINLRRNDGLLADHIAREERIPFAEANEMVRKYAEDCQLRLKMNKQVVIRDVGRLYLGEEGTIQFSQDLRHNLLAESYGLQPFFSVPVRKEQPEEVLEPEAEELSIPRHMAKKAIARPLKWAAVLALPVGVAILMSISGYDRIRTNGLTYADILSSISTKLTPFSPVERIASPASLKKAVPVAKPIMLPSQKVNPVPVVTPEPAKTAVIRNDGSFAIIIGAFRVEENAAKLVSRLNREGISASLYDVTPGGLHRVTAGTFANRGDAIAALRQIRSQGFDGAWLLVK